MLCLRNIWLRASAVVLTWLVWEIRDPIIREFQAPDAPNTDLGGQESWIAREKYNNEVEIVMP